MKIIFFLFFAFASPRAHADVSCMDLREKTLASWNIMINESVRGAVTQKMIESFRTSGKAISADMVNVASKLEVLPVPCETTNTCHDTSQPYRVYGDLAEFEVNAPGEPVRKFGVQLRIENHYDALFRDRTRLDAVSTHPQYNSIGDLLGWACLFTLDAEAYLSITNEQTGAYVGGLNVRLSDLQDPLVPAAK